jgi:hypothetical protein
MTVVSWRLWSVTSGGVPILSSPNNDRLECDYPFA